MKMQIHVVDHPLIKEKMTRLRDKNTQPKDFRQLLDQIAQLLLFEVTRDLPVRHKKVTTPLAETTGYELDVSGITVVPILRAGLGFLDLGVSGTELAFLLLALVLAFALDLAAERAENTGSCLYERFSALPGAVRVAALLVLAVTVLVFACRLVGGDAAAFYYAQF